jgi:O-antigen ligase
LWGVWLGLIPLLSFAVTPKRGFIGQLGSVDTRTNTTESMGVTVAAVALGALPAAFTIMRRYMALDLMRRPMIIFLWILTLIAVSFFPDDIVAKDFGVMALGLYVFSLMTVMGSQQDFTENVARQVLTAMAVFQAVVMVIALADNNYVVGRFQGRIGPNYWGATAFTTLMVSYAVRSGIVRIAVMAVCGYMLIASQNRSAIIAGVSGSTMVAVLYWLRASVRERFVMMIAAAVGFVGCLAASPVILSKVFLVDNARRGLASNGTGRFVAWGEALKVIYEHPVLGVGYRHHEKFISAASSAHNAYLAAFADMGVFGLLTYLAFIYGSIAKSVRSAMSLRHWSYVVTAGYLTACATVNFLETRGINFANSESLGMITCVALAWRANPKVETPPPSELPDVDEAQA